MQVLRNWRSVNEAANERLLTFGETFLLSLHDLQSLTFLRARQEELQYLRADHEEGLLYLHSNLVAAAERHLALEQHRRAVQDHSWWADDDDVELDDDSDGDWDEEERLILLLQCELTTITTTFLWKPCAARGKLNVNNQQHQGLRYGREPLASLLDLALFSTTSTSQQQRYQQYSTLGTATSSASASVSLSVFPAIDRQDPNAALRIAHQLESVRLSCASHMLDLKVDQLKAIAQERSRLFRLFWLFAPKERTSVHLRVHMLEGSLSVAESQLTQNATIAQWVVAQTSQCAENLRELYHQTQRSLSSSVIVNPGSGATGGRSLDGGDVNFHQTVSRFHGMNLTAVKDQLAAEDRTAQVHLQHAQHTCERLIDGVNTLHKRLLESEMLLYHTVGGSSEKDKSVMEAQELLEHSLVAHSVDRELAEDTMRLLRDFLSDERHLALTSIAALLFEVRDRNDEILILRQQHQQLLTLAHSGAWMGEYCALAFAHRDELYGDAFVAVARQYRSAVPYVEETMFQLTVVHYELSTDCLPRMKMP